MSVSVALVFSDHNPPKFLTENAWRPKNGTSVHNSVRIEGDDWGFTTIQGPAAELRRLGRALLRAADQANAWDAAHPADDQVEEQEREAP